MENYSGIKRRKLLIDNNNLGDLKCIMLQEKKAKHERAHTVWFHLREIREQAKLAYGDRNQKKEGAWESALGMMEMSYILIEGWVTQGKTFAKTPQTLALKIGAFHCM